MYLFEDQELMLEERKTLYKKLDENRIDKKELTARMKKAGKILILLDMHLYRSFHSISTVNWSSCRNLEEGRA
jgi:hypothetical protein